MLYPANILEKIQSNGEYNNIFTIHCTKTNECPVEIETEYSTISYPAGSFLAGATYHIYIKKMIFDETKAGFIGYSYKTGE